MDENLEVLRLIDRFENDASLTPRDAEELVVEIFEGCGLEAEYRGGPGDLGVDVEFTTREEDGNERFAVQVKSHKTLIGASDVAAIAGFALSGNYDRWLFLSRTKFSKQAQDLAARMRGVRMELLTPEDLRHWLHRFSYSKTTGGSQLDAIIRTAMKKVVKDIACYPQALYRTEWRDLERVLREAFEGIGFRTELTRPAKDGGFDLRLTLTDNGQEAVYLVEVKHWSAPSRPGDKILKDFVKVIAHVQAKGGVLLSTSGFTQNVAEGLTELERLSVRLGNHNKIIALCKTYYKIDSEIWIADQHLPTLLHELTVEPGTALAV